MRINYATCLKEVGLVFQPSLIFFFNFQREFEFKEASTRR